jgi:branched-chain amino acid transport system substrate-binding protein
MRKRQLLAVCGVTALALLAAACGSDDDSADNTSAPTVAPTEASAPAATDSVAPGESVPADTAGPADTTAASMPAPTKTGVVEIGLLTSLSGRFGVYGAPFRDGAAYGVKQINDAGGFVVGDTTYTFDLKVVDDRSDQAAAVQGATELINDDGVAALIGPIGPLGPSVMELTNAQKVINFSSSSSVGAVAGPPDNPLVFITNGSAAQKVKATVESIQKFAPNATKIAVLGPDDETAAGVDPLLQTAFDAAGLTMTTYLYPTGTTDLSTVETKMVADDPDVVILGWANSDRVTQADQFAAAGLADDVTLFAYADSIGTCKAIAGGRPCIAHPLAGADLTGSSLDSDRQAFVDGYLAFTGEAALPDQVSAVLWTYDYPGMLAQAMTKAGTVEDTEAIGQALHEVTRDGLLGKITFDEQNRSIFGFDITLVAPDGTITTENFG